jgi:hypothetical protein
LGVVIRPTGDARMSVRRIVILLFAACLAAAGLSIPVGAPAATAPASSDVSRQILVMLRLPPKHLRPNDDYGGGYDSAPGQNARRRIAARLAREHGLEVVDNWPMSLVGVDCFVLAVPAGITPQEAATRLSKDPAVAWAQPVNLYQGRDDPAAYNDPLFLAQPAARQWRLAVLNSVATGRNVRVAVIDSLVDGDHPDLAGQIKVDKDFAPVRAAAPEHHGTGVAGVIAARANNGVGIAGVAPHARLMALRACWESAPKPGNPAATVCDSLSLAKALEFAITNRAQVINLSISGPPDPLLAKLLDVAREREIVVVGAYDRDLPGGGFPVSHPGVVGVADDAADAVPAGVYRAPGSDVPTTMPGGRWSLVNGSSYAAAHVSGLFALLRERGRAPDLISSHGAIDACATLLRSAKPCDCGCVQAQEGAPAGRP